MGEFRVSASQMEVTADIERNLQRIIAGIEQAADNGSRLVAFPECAVSGYPPLHHKSLADIDTHRIAEANDEVARAAARCGLWVVFGTILASSKGLTNSALVVSDEGEIVGRYDKMHLMPMDKNFFVFGSEPCLFKMPETDFGVLICYDARFPEPFRFLRNKGAKIIVVISNACGSDTWKVPVLEGTYRTRASENSCFVVAVNAAGPLQMATSRIVNPLGLDLASTNQDCEEVISAQIDLSETDSGYYPDRREDVFGW